MTLHTPGRVQSKLPRVGTTIFTRMTQLAGEQGAINLSQGFPDFNPDGILLDSLKKHSLTKNQYALSLGIMELRVKISETIADIYGAEVSPENEITITSGATEALFVAFQVLVNPGDEVVVFDPAYDSYEPAVTLAGGKTIHIPLRMPGFKVNWGAVSAAISPRTKVIVINSPHNPTGTRLLQHDFMELTKLVCEHNMWCVSDEVYEFMTFDGAKPLGIHSFPKLAARSVSISSFGKTFHATGWKVGYAVAPHDLTEEFRKVHQYVTFSTFTPAQYAFADMLGDRGSRIRELGKFYETKRDVFARAMESSRFKLLPCEGTYFQLADYSEISQMSDVEFCLYLTCEHKVAAIPLSVFYAEPPDNKLIRLCFAKDVGTLEQAAERLSRL